MELCIMINQSGRKLIEVTIRTTKQLKDLKYKGVLFVKCSEPVDHPPEDATADAAASPNDIRELYHPSSTQQVLVNLDGIQTAIKLCIHDAILNCGLCITFKNEAGDDFQGLTREFFCCFWNTLIPPASTK